MELGQGGAARPVGANGGSGPVWKDVAGRASRVQCLETGVVGVGHRSGGCSFPIMQGNSAHSQGSPGREESPPGGGAERGSVPTSPLSLAPLPSEAGMGVGIDGNLSPPSPLSPPHSLPFSERLRYYSAFVKKGIK